MLTEVHSLAVKMTWTTLLAQNFNIYLPLQSLGLDNCPHHKNPNEDRVHHPQRCPQEAISKDPWFSRAGLLNINTLDILDLVTCGGG